jgi:SPP1 gp7 family putative phage head morphogenesis protein
MAPTTASFSNRKLARDVINASLTMERRYLRSFFRMVSRLTTNVQLVNILQDAADGQFQAVTPNVLDRIEALEIDTNELVDILRQAMVQAGQVTANSIGLDLDFNIRNPRAINTARSIGADAITAINGTTKEVVRMLVADVIENDMSIGEAKKLVRREIGLLPSHVKAVNNYHAQLIAAGSKKGAARKLADEYADRLRRYRANMITRTEIAQATSLGQLEYWKQAQDEQVIPSTAMRVWITAQDERTCPICAPMNGQEATINGVWFTGSGEVSYPTAVHPQCRCTSGLVFPDEVGKADRAGYERWLVTQCHRKSPISKHLPGSHDQSRHSGANDMGAHPLDMSSVGVEREDIAYSDALLELDTVVGGLRYMQSETGSFYDEIDWDSDVDPVTQMTDNFEDFTGVKTFGFREEGKRMSVEAVAEMYDASTAMIEELGYGPDTIYFDKGAKLLGNRSLAAVGICDIERFDSSAEAFYAGETRRANMQSALSQETAGQVMLVRPGQLMSSSVERARQNHLAGAKAAQDGSESWWPPTQLQPLQSVIVHEFGHITKNKMARETPQGLFDVEAAVVSTIAPYGGMASGTPRTIGWGVQTGTQSFPKGTGPKKLAQLLSSDKEVGDFRMSPAYRGITSKMNTPMGGTTRFSLGNKKTYISDYSQTNGQEFFAETFVMSYGNFGSNPPTLKWSSSSPKTGTQTLMEGFEPIAINQLRGNVRNSFRNAMDIAMPRIEG